jgi:serine/threonine-protein kinase
LLGTAGYMAPEQIHDATRVAGAADVYALGAVLFEILTGGDPLHPRRATEAIANTLEGTPSSPSQRAPDRAIPPELDALCLEAIAREPDQRPTARALGERIERYLDGDRDLERRRTLAAELLAQARDAAADPKRHAEAMRLAGRAVGLDPESPDAPALVTQLLVKPPAEDPPELVERFEAYDHRISLEGVRLGAGLFFGVFSAIVPFLVWVGVRDWSVIVTLVGLAVLNAIVGILQIKLRRPNDLLALVLVLGFSVVISRISGPYLVGPALISGVMINLGAQAAFLRRPRWVLISLILTAFFLPIVFEQVGWFPTTTQFDHDAMLVYSQALTLEHGDRVQLLLWVSYAGILTAAGLMSMRVGKERRTAQRESLRRTWHLENLWLRRPSHTSG